MKTISILGSTGSIGKQALEVAKLHKLKVTALAAHSSMDLLELQARIIKPEYVCIYNEGLFKPLSDRLFGTGVKVLSGMDGLCAIAADTNHEIMLNSVVGMVGLLPTLTAINAGKDIALANKETLVAGGSLVMKSAAEKNVRIFPVDSEHSAIFQCMQGNNPKQVNKIILTASGGPFYGKTAEELKEVTVEQALRHPNWSMGNKITIDSATLMNKGLEFIEAKWLFDIDPKNIEIVVHRQSVLHSAVEYKDYSVIGQLGTPDMKIPIQYALLYPERCECNVKRLSLTEYGTLTFDKPDYDTFKCLSTAIRAMELGGAYPCIANGANEAAVELFLNRKISFLDIGRLVEAAVDHLEYRELHSYEDVIEADKKAREFVENHIKKL